MRRPDRAWLRRCATTASVILTALSNWAALGAAQAPARGRTPAPMKHWRLVSPSAAAADSGAPHLDANIGFTTVNGERRVDATFVPDTDAYVVAAHLGPDGVVRFVYPARPIDDGFARGGYATIVPTFLAGRASQFAALRARLFGGATPASAVVDSYDGGTGYLFLVASTQPLHTNLFVMNGQWAAYALADSDLADPHAAIAELAAALADESAPYSITYVRPSASDRVVDAAPSEGRVHVTEIGAVDEGAYADAPIYPAPYGESYGYPYYGDYAYDDAFAFANGYAFGFTSGFSHGFLSGACADDGLFVVRSFGGLHRSRLGARGFGRRGSEFGRVGFSSLGFGGLGGFGACGSTWGIHAPFVIGRRSRAFGMLPSRRTEVPGYVLPRPGIIVPPRSHATPRGAIGGSGAPVVVTPSLPRRSAPARRGGGWIATGPAAAPPSIPDPRQEPTVFRRPALPGGAATGYVITPGAALSGGAAPRDFVTREYHLPAYGRRGAPEGGAAPGAAAPRASGYRRNVPAYGQPTPGYGAPVYAAPAPRHAAPAGAAPGYAAPVNRGPTYAAPAPAPGQGAPAATTPRGVYAPPAGGVLPRGWRGRTP